VPNAARTAHRSCAAHPVLLVVAITLPFQYALRSMSRCRYLLLLFRGATFSKQAGSINAVKGMTFMNRWS
jgi:hypothetical protein